MMYRLHPVVKVIIRWDESEYKQYNEYQNWLSKNSIYPASRGGGGSWDKNSWLYSEEDAKAIENYLKDVGGRRVEILPS